MYVAPVAVLGRLLPAPHRLDRGAEAVHLRAGVVVVVLALDRVARELEQPRDAVAVRAVPRGGDRDRAGRVRRHHLDLDPLAGSRRAGAVVLADLGRPPRRRTASVSHRLTKPGPGDLGALDLGQRRRPSRRAPRRARAAGAACRGARAERDVRRVVAVRRVARALELDLLAGQLADRRREAIDGVRRQRPSRGANSSSSARSSGSVPIAIRTSPASNRRSGLGVVSKRAVRACAARRSRRRSSLPDPQVADRAARPARESGRTSISSKRRSGPACDETISRNAATCGFSASFAISVPALEYGCTTRSAPGERRASAPPRRRRRGRRSSGRAGARGPRA